MSKFWDVLLARPTGKQHHILRKFMTYEAGPVGPVPTNVSTGTEYEVSAKVAARFIIDDALRGLDRDAAFDYHVKTSRRAIVEAVFGEFRIPLLEALGALAHNDAREAERLVDSVLRTMFDGDR